MESKPFDTISAAALSIMENSRLLQESCNEMIERLQAELRRKDEEFLELSSSAQQKHDELLKTHEFELQSLQAVISSKDETIHTLQRSLEESSSVHKILETKLTMLNSQLIELRKTLAEKDILWPL